MQSASDSDDGLPPPIPAQKSAFIPKLSIGGLGISSLANAGGKTAEELADEKTL